MNKQPESPIVCDLDFRKLRGNGLQPVRKMTRQKFRSDERYINKVKLIRAEKIFHSQVGLSWLETPHIGRVCVGVLCVFCPQAGQSLLIVLVLKHAPLERYVRTAILHSIQHSRSRSSRCLFPVILPSTTNGTR